MFNELQRFLASGDVDLSGHLPAEASQSGNGPAIDHNLTLEKAIEEFEKFYIPRSLKLHEGHKGKTAENLQIDRKTLYRKLKKFDLV